VPGVALAETIDERCISEIEVVGYRPCPDFGSWGAAVESPYAVVHLGFTMRNIHSRVSAQDVAAKATGPIERGDRADTSLSLTERVMIAFTDNAHMSMEVEFGLVDDDKWEAGRAQLVAGGLLGGGVRGSIGFASLGVDLVGGIHAIEVQHATTSESEFRGVLEARARLDLWLGPWVSLGGALGSSLFERGDWMAGLYIGLHSRSWGGTR
jgi:hypothetical protein